MKPYAIGSILVVLILMAVFLVWSDRSELTTAPPAASAEPIDIVDGTFVSVLDEPTVVEGIDVSVGSTSIRTTGTGRFVFTAVDPDAGITITHPELRRPFRLVGETFLDQPGLTTVPFSVSLYNQLVAVIDAEARDLRAARYEQLYQSVRDRLSLEEFVAIAPALAVPPDHIVGPVTIVNVSETTYVSELLSGRLEVIHFQVNLATGLADYYFIADTAEADRTYWRVL